jgi:hypothetical protein
MALLTKQQIVSVVDIESEIVHVPEWGGDVMVKAMNGAERDAFESAQVQVKDKKVEFNGVNIRARMAAACIVDEQGQRLFSDKEVDLLGRKSAAALDRVYAVALRLSGMSKKDSEELMGNFESGPNSSSTAGSVSPLAG